LLCGSFVGVDRNGTAFDDGELVGLDMFLVDDDMFGIGDDMFPVIFRKYFSSRNFLAKYFLNRKFSHDQNFSQVRLRFRHQKFGKYYRKHLPNITPLPLTTHNIIRHTTRSPITKTPTDNQTIKTCTQINLVRFASPWPS
jgi:hypothetical protein